MSAPTGVLPEPGVAYAVEEESITSSFPPGAAVPMPTLPSSLIRIFSVSEPPAEAVENIKSAPGWVA